MKKIFGLLLAGIIFVAFTGLGFAEEAKKPAAATEKKEAAPAEKKEEKK